jgi:hypothetical protein
MISLFPAMIYCARSVPCCQGIIAKYLHLSLLDLAPLEEIEAQMERRRVRERTAEIAFLENPFGPGHAWSGAVNWRKTFPAPFSGATVPQDLWMAHVVRDPAMAVTLASYDVALLDTSAAQRRALSPDGLYVIERGGEAVMRYIRSGARWHYLVTDSQMDSPTLWEPLRLSDERFDQALKARVVWLGRERERDTYPRHSRLLYDPISS